MSWNEVNANNPIDDLRKGIDDILTNRSVVPTIFIFSPNEYELFLKYLKKNGIKVGNNK